MKRCLICLLALWLCLCPLYAFAEEQLQPSASPAPEETASPTPVATPAASPTPTATIEAVTAIPTLQPTPTPRPLADPGLRIDSENIHPGMDRSFASGYVPRIKNSRAWIVLPLVGNNPSGTADAMLDLGSSVDSPFVFGNYAQRVTGEEGLYLFTFEVPLAKERINGSYPVSAHVEYQTVDGDLLSQTFTLYVTITDGMDPPDPMDIPKVGAEAPQLFVHTCRVEPGTVSGGSGFTLTVELENIGNLKARSILIRCGRQDGMIRGAAGSQAQHAEDLAAGKKMEVELELLTDPACLSGRQEFTLNLEYRDYYGGQYSASETLSVQVEQPAGFSFDPPKAPNEIYTGETFTLPANIFNTGKSTLREVTVSVEGGGLFPVASAYLGDIPPGEAHYGEVKVFVGMLTMSEGYTNPYGPTTGCWILRFKDETGKEYEEIVDLSLTVLEPVPETTPMPLEEETPDRSRWGITVFLGIAIIAVLVSWIVTGHVLRRLLLSRK